MKKMLGEDSGDEQQETVETTVETKTPVQKVKPRLTRKPAATIQSEKKSFNERAF